ncbi:MAG: DUF342 domain-containing protein [Nitrospirae bacterium]|nr:DUF342 domain-containing protein [Nitrospirota bacterium]
MPIQQETPSATLPDPTEGESVRVPIKVDISSDDMEAYISFDPMDLRTGMESKVEAIHLKEALNSRKVLMGIIPKQAQQCMDMIRKLEAFSGLLIAKGTLPEDGKDAEYVPSEKVGRTGPLVTEEGTIDYKEHSTILPVVKGDVLGTKRPATPGKTGFTVTGRVLRTKPGVDTAPKPGTNVEIEKTEDGGYIYKAAADGGYRLEHNTVHVSQITVIDGDVDYSTGNIRCNGDLDVKGGVASGFKIEVQGNLDVHEAVEAAEITAGGDVHVHRGVKGQGSAKIKCGRDFRAMYVERATLEAGRHVDVGTALLDCKVSAGGKVTVLRGRGVIIGGEIRASQGVEVKQLGSDVAGLTTVDVGIDFGRERELKAVNEEIKDVETMIAKIERAVSTDLLKKDDLSWLPAERMSAAQKLQTRWKELIAHRNELHLRRDKLSGDEGEGKYSRPTIRVTQKLSARVRTRFAQSTFTTDRDYYNVTLYEDPDRKEVRLIQK